MLDVEHHLALDEQVVVEDQRVLREVDRALDRVLDGDEAEVDLAVGHGLEHVGHRRQRHQLGRGQVGLAEERLLGERAQGAEEADPQAGTVGRRHPRQNSEVDPTALSELLAAVAAGELDVGAAADRLRRLPYADLGFARVDHHRPLRQGMPEAVYGPGKTPEQCVAIVGELLHGGDDPVVLTRASDEQRAAVEAAHPGAIVSGTTVVWRPVAPTRPERVVIAAAGTADGPVADECEAVLRAYGFSPVRAGRRRRGRPPPPARPHRRRSPPPMPSSSWPAWRARWPAWSAV